VNPFFFPKTFSLAFFAPTSKKHHKRNFGRVLLNFFRIRFENAFS